MICVPYLATNKRLRVFENMVLRRIFGPTRGEVIGGWRKLYNDEFHNWYFSPNIIRMMKSKRMRFAGHVTRMGGEECIKVIAGKAIKLYH
jgi:hypothetical protein